MRYIAHSYSCHYIYKSRPFIVQVHVYNNYLTDDADVTSLEEEFADYVGMNLNDYQINFDLTEYLDLNGTDESSYTSMMKVMAMAAAHDLDVIGGNIAFVNSNPVFKAHEVGRGKHPSFQTSGSKDRFKKSAR